MSAGGTTSSSSPTYPKWAKPYIIQGLNESSRLYGGRQPPPSLYPGMDPRRREFLSGRAQNIVDPALEGFEATLRGDYLTGSPYQDTVINRALGDVQGRVGGQFAGSGRYGGGQWAASLADAMTGTAASYRDQNYQAERDRMLQAQQGAGQMLGLGEYVGSAFEEDAAMQQEEAYRQFRAPQEQLNEFLSQVYGNPAVQHPGQKTTSKKDINWLDIVGGLLGGGGGGGGMCWVADELFGAYSEEAYDARSWCRMHQSHPFVRVYRRFGRAWAAWLSVHPWAKPLARPVWSWMARRGREERRVALRNAV